MKVTGLVLLVILFFFLRASPTFADFTFALPKTEFSDEEEIELNTTLSLQGQNNKSYYIAGALKKETDNNYFGLTWNDLTWIEYSNNYSELKQITTNEQGLWSGNIKVKLDKENNLYTGPGQYLIKLKRFTSTGSSNNWSDNTETVTIIGGSSTSTATPQPTPSVTPSPSASTEPSSTFIISNTPNNINANQELIMTANLNTPASPNASFYLKGAFKKSDSTNYFGYTQVNSDWIKNKETYSKQLLITTNDSGVWDSKITVKADIEDSGFKGSGEYLLKLARYSLTGSGPIWSNEVLVTITSTATPLPTNITLPSTPQATAKPSPTPHQLLSNLPKPISTKSANLSADIEDNIGSSSSSLLGISTASATPSNTYIKNDKLNNQMIRKVPFVVGGIMIIFSIGWVAYPKFLWIQERYLNNLFKHE